MQQTDFRRNYIELCTEIDLLSLHIHGVEKEMDYLKQKALRDSAPSQRMVASYSGMPHAGTPFTTFEHQWTAITILERKLADLKAILLVKAEVRKSMEERLSRIEDIDRRVLIMRDVQRKSLKQIADELEYSYGYIRNISLRLNRMYTSNTKLGTIRMNIS